MKIKTSSAKTTNTDVKHKNKVMPMREFNLEFNQSIQPIPKYNF